MLETKVCTEKNAPRLDLIRFGLYKSHLGFDKITASTLETSLVLKIAPILPGFSIDSSTSIIGFLFFFFKI